MFECDCPLCLPIAETKNANHLSFRDLQHHNQFHEEYWPPNGLHEQVYGVKWKEEPWPEKEKDKTNEWLKELDKKLNDIVPLANRPLCSHRWRTYQGLNETYDYCEWCDQKR